jgi:hypothetical protein
VNSEIAAPSPPDLLTRAIAGFLVLILVDAAQLLAFYPDRTDTLWAWTIEPPLTAMLLGSVYLAGAYFFARVLFGAPWEEVQAGVPAIVLFVWMAALATALHLDRFHDDSLPFAAWAALYIATPIAVPWLYLRNRVRRTGPPLPRAVRIALGAAGAAIVSFSIVLFVVPDVGVDDWAWTLTPLTTRITAAVLALYGAVWLSVALHGTSTAARIPLQAHALGLAVLIVAAVRGEEAVDWGNAIAPGVIAVAAVMATVSALLAWRAA